MRRALFPVGGIVVAILAGCGRGGGLPPFTRLLPALGPPEPLTLDAVTRPATLLRSGETRGCAIEAGPDARLRLWVGLAKPRARGFLRVRATASGRPVADRRLAVGRLSEWMEVSGPVPAEARDLRVSVQLETGGGRPADPGEEADTLVALGSPRLVRRSAATGRILVWISQDTVRADRLSTYGYGRPTTPVLDRLAEESFLFEDAMATASWTLPSLASQATSLLPHEHGATDRRRARRPAAGPTVFETLAQSGFTVLGASANLFFSAPYGLADGFDALVVQNVAAAHVLRDRLMERLREWDGGDLALFVHFMDPHLPYVPPSPYAERFAAPGEPPDDAAPAERRRRELSAAYDGEIAWTDAQIGVLLELLDRRGLRDRAVIVYTADHGDEFLEHGRFDHGQSLYQELVHVPLVVRVPGRAPRRIPGPVSMIDVAPTILDALGVPAPASFRGQSLLPLAAGVRRDGRLFAETRATKPFHRPHYAVREGALKYVLQFAANDDATIVAHELFDLSADPREQAGAAAAGHPLEREAKAYAAAARGAREHREAAIDRAVEEQLQALGYIR